MKLLSATIFALFFSLNVSAQWGAGGPPPPPPGGSELWGGTSAIPYDGEPTTCYRCDGTELGGICWGPGIFNIIAFTPYPCGEDGFVYEEWNWFDLRRALEGSSALPGGFLGFLSILNGIKDGVITDLSNAEWDLVIDYSGSELVSACNEARKTGYEPSACVDVPLPFFLEILLFLTGLLFIFKHYNPTQYQALLLKLRSK